MPNYVDEANEDLISICHTFVEQIYAFKNTFSEQEIVQAQAVKNNVLQFIETLKNGQIKEFKY